MSGRTRSGGAAHRSEPRTPSPTKSLRKSQWKSGSDLPSSLPEVCQKAPHPTSVRKPIVLKKIMAHAVKAPVDHLTRRSPRIAFFLAKENNPPLSEPTKEDLFKLRSFPVIPTTTPVLYPLEVESNSRKWESDGRDLEMSMKVRRSYSRLETLSCASTSTQGRRSCCGFKEPEGLAKVSPVVCSKLMEVCKVPVKLWPPDIMLPGISPQVLKEKHKKRKVPAILKSELDEWAAAMNAEFEAAEQFGLLVQ
ncbi:LOW QUALITY PROTEIN: sororin-like [Ctenodactylus gundi]